MYIVNNMTSKTINISDLRVEIGPHRIVDLEKIVTLSAIEQSLDLVRAFDQKLLRVIRHTVVKTNKELKPVNPQLSAISEDVLLSIRDEIRSLNNSGDVDDKIKNIVHGNLKDVVQTLREDIATGFKNVAKNSSKDESKNQDNGVPPEKLAELQQRSIAAMSEDIEMGVNKKPKVVKIINKKKLSDLANEL